MYTANIYIWILKWLITLTKVCQSCVFTPPNSPFFVKIFFMFEHKTVGNLIFWMTFFTPFLCFYVNNHGRLFWSPSLFDRITLSIAWLASRMSLQILTIFSLSLLPAMIRHNVSVTFFPICIVSNKWTIFRSL